MPSHPETHLCGRCRAEFQDEEEYFAHECPKTGLSPTDPAHFGRRARRASQAALERGAAAQEN